MHIENHEFSISLFTKCNMNCDFCFQSRVNDVDIEAIKNIPNIFKDNYPEELKFDKLKNISISIKGGELFSDDIPDSMFEVYKDLCDNLSNIIKSYLININITFVWISNGVTSKPERILKLFNDTDISNHLITLSYDPIGRFKTKEQFEMFQNTFWYFYNNYKTLTRLNITLTKPNIDSIINNKEIFINTIPKDTLILLNYYSPNKNWKFFQPNDEDLYNFFLWSINNNKFKFHKLKILLDIIYFNKNSVNVCGSDKTISYYNREIFKDTTLEKEDDKSLIAIEKRGCLYCEYSNVCIEQSWPNLLFDEYKASECFLKRIIRYIYDHPGIKDKYLEFMEKNNE